MRISVFGLGYVGTVTCGCLAREGHTVIGVDVLKEKVDLINAGHSTVIEHQIGDFIKEGISRGLLKATQDVGTAIKGSDISFVSVGTPSQLNGSLDLTFVQRVCAQIGAVDKAGFHVVVIRSTMLPGSTRDVVIPTLEKSSGKKAGIDFGVVYNPEFLREGTSVNDFYNPSKTVIGATDPKSSALIREIYEKFPGEIFETSIEVSEAVKYADNNFHAVKITFANEIGVICKELKIDSHEVMDIFCKDTKLNLSPYYLKPGFAFGGSCLPKDVRALTYKSKMLDVETPLLNSILISNEKQIRNTIKKIIELGKKQIGFLGFSFKAGTDDLRESPMIEMIETLLGKGYKIKLYDKNVNFARLIGANKVYIQQRIPHITELMCSTIEEVISESEVIVIGNKSEEFKGVLTKVNSQKIIFDLVRIDPQWKTERNYMGLFW
jgi:GDP-mannose 6-dehydrogenase